MTRATIHLLKEAASTNELALEAAAKGAAEGTVFVADFQTSGRGRREGTGERRVWFSPPGKNLYLSLVLRPGLAPEKLAAITLALGAALVEALREHSELDLWLKWPNDIYIGEKKVAGILTEAATGPSGIEGVVVGLGLNVNLQRKDLPESLQGSATSLFEAANRHFDRLSLALLVSEALVAGCREYVEAGLGAFLERLNAMDRLSGRGVRVRENGDWSTGRAAGIGPAGGLLVVLDEGRTIEVTSGEVRVDGLGEKR